MQTENDTGTKGKARKFSKSPPVELTRTFKAPIELVFEAWVQPELIKQWWGPEGYSCPEAQINFMVGGKNLLAMKSPDGKTIWSTGTYKEILLRQIPWVWPATGMSPVCSVSAFIRPMAPARS